jgi:Rrf2 family protein
VCAVILSQTAAYALKAVLYLVDSDPGEYARVEDIAAALDVPRNYLSKILHALARAGVLTSSRGPGGGFRLGMDPGKLTLQRVIATFDDGPGNPGCLLGRKRCSDTNPCMAHARWKGVSTAVHDFFSETTVGDLARESGLREAALS